MIYLGIFAISIAFWITYEIWRAPFMDDNGNVINKKDDSTKSNDTNNTKK
jgi:hypothetical protein